MKITEKKEVEGMKLEIEETRKILRDFVSGKLIHSDGKFYTPQEIKKKHKSLL